MATQTSIRSRQKSKKSDDSVVLKVMIALALLVFSIYMLQVISNAYGTLDGFERLYPVMLTVTLVCAALAVVSIVLALVLKNRTVRAICPYTAAVFALFAVTALALRLFWVQPLHALYILNAAVYCLYIVYMLYRMEFFLVSLITVLAGTVFYFFSNGFGLNARSIVLALILLAAIAIVAVIAMQAGKRNGLVPLAGCTYRVFPPKFSPVMLCITCAVWLVCFVLTLILGATFSYYCMFAAVAFELIAAVYYTFQLK